MNKIKVKVQAKSVEQIALLLYLCAEHAHQNGYGFDRIFLLSTFALYASLVLFRIFIERELLVNGYLKWQLLFYAYLLLSCIWAEDKGYAFGYFTRFLRIIVLIVGLTTIIKTKEDVISYMKVHYAAIIYMCIVLILKSPSSHWGTTDLGSSLGLWKNFLGLYAATGFIYSIYFFKAAKNYRGKILNIIAMTLLIFISVMSGSRKAFFMLPLSIIFILWLEKKRKLTVNEVLKVLFFLIVSLIVIFVGYRFIMTNELLYSAIGRRIESMINVLLYDASETSMDERAFYIRKARELFLTAPIFGAGSNSFRTYMRDIGYHHVAYCHNNFWEILSTLGIIGFVIYYYMPAKCLVKIFPARRDMQMDRRLSATLWTMLGILVFMGWWMVYYPIVSTNYTFILIYMFYYVSNFTCVKLNTAN